MICTLLENHDAWCLCFEPMILMVAVAALALAALPWTDEEIDEVHDSLVG